MQKIKRIVVGIDIYEKSNNVLKRALYLANENHAKLFVVYAVKTPWFSVPSYFGSEDIEVDTEGITKKINKQIKRLSKDINVTSYVLVKEGNPSDIIEYEAKLLKADMIVIGANAKSKSKVLGSIAEKVAHRSHLPVLFVKNAAKGSYKNIVAPTDFQGQSKQSIMFAKEVFPKAKIKPVHSFEEIYIEGPYTIEVPDLVQFNELAKVHTQNNLKELVNELSIQKGKMLDGGFNNKQALVNYINKGNYDLTVLGSQSTAGLKSLLGSMALSILRESATDVLVYMG